MVRTTPWRRIQSGSVGTDAVSPKVKSRIAATRRTKFASNKVLLSILTRNEVCRVMNRQNFGQAKLLLKISKKAKCYSEIRKLSTGVTCSNISLTVRWATGMDPAMKFKLSYLLKISGKKGEKRWRVWEVELAVIVEHNTLLIRLLSDWRCLSQVSCILQT